MFTEDELAIMDFDDGDFDESMDEIGTVRETGALLKEEVKSEERPAQELDSGKTHSYLL